MSWTQAINFPKLLRLSYFSYSDTVFILAAAVWLQLACSQSPDRLRRHKSFKGVGEHMYRGQVLSWALKDVAS